MQVVQIAGVAFLEASPPLCVPFCRPYVGRVGVWGAGQGEDLSALKEGGLRRWSPTQLMCVC